MKEFKGTKGEWFIDNNQIKSIQKEKRTFKFHDFVANLEFEKGQSSDESVYDAKLIAAAPELLQTVIELHTLLEEHLPNWYLKRHDNIVKNVLKKALN